MRHRPFDILLVEDDLELAGLVETLLCSSLHCSVTHSETAADAVREELTTRHHLVITALSLPDESGLELIRALRVHNRCPILLMADSPSAEDAVAAMRLGVADLLHKPFEMEYLSSVVKRLAGLERRRRIQVRRHRRLRKLVARIVCERRDLARRIDLLCRDFVHAHRRLAEKITRSGMLAGSDE